MSVDVEDYFQVSAFDRAVRREVWSAFLSRVSGNTGRLLDLFAREQVRATFFVLGWVAERFPGLVRTIASAGHEVGSHGYGHRLVYSQSPEEFREDIRRAKAAIESASGMPVVGYRAPSFSITRESLWAFDVLAEEGYLYDTSVYPVHHDRYGIPDAPRRPYRVVRGSGELWEVPGTTARVAGVNVPVGGGGYLRILPYAVTRWGFSRINRREGVPGVFYIHPWELDPDQPQIKGAGWRRMRHYLGLSKTEKRLVRLLKDFRFGTVRELVESLEPEVSAARANLAEPVLVTQ